MGYMKSVDIVLTAHKLSDAQKNGVVELLSGGFTTAKPNTIKALVNKGLVIDEGGSYSFEESFHAELREAYALPEAREEESIESLLQGDPWKIGDAITADEADLEFDEKHSVDPETGAKAEKFGFPMANWELELLGLEFLIGWNGTEVWDGLSLEEIKEDIATAYPVGRQARRVHHRTLRNAFRRLAVSQSPETRKSIKITGKVGV